MAPEAEALAAQQAPPAPNPDIHYQLGPDSLPRADVPKGDVVFEILEESLKALTVKALLLNLQAKTRSGAIWASAPKTALAMRKPVRPRAATANARAVPDHSLAQCRKSMRTYTADETIESLTVCMLPNCRV